MGELTMTKAEREVFLAAVHIGVLAIAEDGQAPLISPVWYSYEPGGAITFVIGGSSQKAKALAQAGRASLCAQTETPPYQYVTVEGPVTIEPACEPTLRRAIARRYLGDELGDAYVEATEAEAADSVTAYLSPERWRTTDFAKVFGTSG